MQDMFDDESLRHLPNALAVLASGYGNLPPFEPLGNNEAQQRAIGNILGDVAERMQNNYPYAHPFYAGQMLKPPHPVARLAYSLAMYVNPNNHALDGGRESSAMEKQAVASIAAMFGYDPDHFLGHLTGGGTLANLEALWISGLLHPGKAIVASDQGHYTHSRLTEVLKIPFQAIASDSTGRMRLDALEASLAAGNVGTVVVTLGTTSSGSVDPLPQILDLQRTYDFRIHIDSAYGGYFKLATNLDQEATASYSLMHHADSIVVDPHKHGLQPYGCGCVLFKDPAVAKYYHHDSPYTYFSSADLHLGEISLECSRAGASAVALWATMQLLPLEAGKEFARHIEMSRQAAIRFASLLGADPRYVVPFAPELDIVLFAINAPSASYASRLARETFQTCAEADMHLAVAQLPRRFFEKSFAATNPDFVWDQDNVTCLRSCLLKPEHLEWIDRIFGRLSENTVVPV